MASVGIRELRDNISAVIRRVVQREGRAQPASVDLLEYEPPPREAGEPLLSEVLAELRADER